MRLAIVSAALCAVALAQPKPSFEVASIKPADPSPMGRIQIAMNVDDAMLRYNNVSLKDCIRVAYRVKDYQIEGPDFIGDTRYNITAKLPSGATEKDVPEMLQTLLADRFKLTAHRDRKEHAVYALVADKGGAKLKAAEVPTGDSAPPAPAGGGGAGGGLVGARGGRGGRGAMMMMGPDGLHVKASSTTLSDLGEMLSRFMEKPIVDMTGIAGQYDFDLAFFPETTPVIAGPKGPGPGGHEGHPTDAAGESGGTIFDALQRYGLKLESRKAPMEIITIDHMEKTPTEN